MNVALYARPQAQKVSRRRLVLLAPREANVPAAFSETNFDRSAHADLLERLQRFRGKTYLCDGAISETDLDASGCHKLEVDERSWHVVSLDDNDEVCGCSRFTLYANTVPFTELGVSKSALAKCSVWGNKFRAAVEKEKRLARRENALFAEVGGWAIDESLRRTTEALKVALATYALGQIAGPCITLTTATVRHHSATVLRKIGGRSLFVGSTELPRYFDAQYGCDMEIVRFDSSAPNSKFEPWIEQIRSEMSAVQVLSARQERHHGLVRAWPLHGESVRALRMPLAWQFR